MSRFYFSLLVIFKISSRYVLVLKNAQKRSKSIISKDILKFCSITYKLLPIDFLDASVINTVVKDYFCTLLILICHTNLNTLSTCKTWELRWHVDQLCFHFLYTCHINRSLFTGLLLSLKGWCRIGIWNKHFPTWDIIKHLYFQCSPW